LQHFTSERMVRETINVYKKVLNCSTAETSKFENEDSAPLVSIILPCYNEEKYLEDCLKSILAHNYTNFELIIINDGSTDQTENVINATKDIRIVYLKNDINKGITYSLNKAIKLAKGKYTCRMDADDKMVLNRLKLQIEFLENNQDYGMVGSWMNIIDSFGMPVSRIELPTDNMDIKLSMLFYNPFAHPAVTLRTEIAKKLKYNARFKYCEDYDLWFRIAARFKVKNLPIALVEYRTHLKNSSTSNQKLTQRNVMELLSRELDNLGIAHTVEELMLHSALGFGYGVKYFNTSEKLSKLNSWLDKIFVSNKLLQAYSAKTLKKFKKELLVELNVS
jgi:glycosyltransferase involved in cell wall biosynthesis